MLVEHQEAALEQADAGARWAVAENMVDLMLSVLSDGLDHPELWNALPDFVRDQPMLVPALEERLRNGFGVDTLPVRLLLGVCGAAQGEGAEMLDLLNPLAVEHSQSALVQGVLFHIAGMIDPNNPKYRFAGKICPTPFVQMDVLEQSSHLCCASWINTSVGNLSSREWEAVWNSDTAQAIRASIHDGSHRYCNKGTCPTIQSNNLTPSDVLAERSERWREILVGQLTAIGEGPQVVNLAYDRTCNLSCPSCRVEAFAADAATRSHFAAMQERTILPMLRNAKLVFVTGSGDPFASKNFRQLMHQLTPEEYPELRFLIMTNGMLFTRRQWESFPSLHGRVQALKISIDAAAGPTHEMLRRGARWPVMLENMAFAGSLLSDGLIDHYELVFTVQAENFREMGDAVDLARQVGASGIRFLRLTNWGTFTSEQYRDKAVFLPSHPEYEDFLAEMRDPRLADPCIMASDLFPDGAVDIQRKGYMPGDVPA